MYCKPVKVEMFEYDSTYIQDTSHGEGFKYTIYSPTQNFQKYLIDKGYEATEDYNCFIIPTKEDIMALLVWITRGDNEWAVIVTANKDKIISCFEASDMTQNIVIDKNLVISQYIWAD